MAKQKDKRSRKELQDRVWACTEPGYSGYSDEIDRLLNFIPVSTLKRYVDRFYPTTERKKRIKNVV